MALKLNGTNSVAAPAYAGDDADTGLQCGTNELKLVTGGTARATVDSSGRVGIGTSSPSDANSNADDLVIQATGSGAGITIFSDTNNFGNIFFGDSSSAAHRGRVRYDHTNDALTFSTSANERCRILSGGGLTFNGDTAQANALHDYEEGTFTPRLVIENSGTVTTDDQDGSYVKVGSTVTVWFNMTVNGTPSGRSTSNAIEFHDLPFTSTNDGNDGAIYYIGSVRLNGVDTSHTYSDFSEAILRLNNNNTYGRIECREASTSALRNSSLWLKDNTTIHAALTYRTDS